LVETPLRQRFLVKAAPGLPNSRLEIGPARAKVTISAEPLFHSIGASRQGIAPALSWQLLTADSETNINPWDACHAMLEQGLGVSGARAEFAEPDLAQSWRIGDPRTVGLKLAKSCNDADRQNPDFPLGPSDYWIRDADHSQFDQAIAKAGAPRQGRTRVAHLDTGYSDHQATPQFLNRDLQRNFVDKDRPHDATDVAASPRTFFDGVAAWRIREQPRNIDRQWTNCAVGGRRRHWASSGAQRPDQGAR